MNRYRWALAAAVALLLGAVGIVALYQPTPPDPTGGDGTGSSAGALIAVADRQPAPEFTGIQGWLNSPPIVLRDQHRGATLIDFWTFSCVNCTRTIPHLQGLLQRYQTDGLRIVGVHSPEFDFEKDPGNVREAVQRLGVTWPVALDPDMATWNAWGNQYWPAEYLVDQNGRVAYVSFGEGNDDRTDAAIRALVGPPATSVTAAPVVLPGGGISPELYAGGQSSQQHSTALGDGEQLASPGQVTALPPSAAPARQRDAIEVSGAWIDRGDHLEAASDGHVRLRFHAADVFIVAGTTGGSLAATVTLDGAPVPRPMAGPALSGGVVAVGHSDLYHVLTGIGSGDHVLDIAVPKGFQLFTFTFG